MIENGFNVKGNYAGKIVVNGLKQNTDYNLQYILQNITGNTHNVTIFANQETTTTIKMFSTLTGGKFNTGNYTEINIWFYANLGQQGEANFTNIQLEEGTVATDYVPYNSLEIKDTGENLLNIFDENWKVYYGIKQSDGSIKANIQDQYYISIQNTTAYWKNYIMQNKGKTITFSQKETISNCGLGIVIYGERTSTTIDYQVVEGKPNQRSISLTIADDFKNVSRIELRTLKKQPVQKFTDKTTVVSELKLKKEQQKHNTNHTKNKK